MTTDTRTRRRAPAAQTERLRKYRPDIQGLRAVAIMMVVSMHCGILDIHGGVDVSFVLSGFLIGGQLFAEIDKTGKVAARVIGDVTKQTLLGMVKDAG